MQYLCISLHCLQLMGSRRVTLSLDRPRQLKEIQAQYRISQMFGELLHDPSVSQKNWKNMKRYVKKTCKTIEKYAKNQNVKRKPKRKTTKTDGFFTISSGFSQLWISCHDLKAQLLAHHYCDLRLGHGEDFLVKNHQFCPKHICCFMLNV